tara:strand:- start:1205 stop:1561 length:357 start_codon:yes stop_codon:yes gene_type:complete
MTTLQENIKLDFDSWNIKLTENDRRNVLKLYVKLNKVESQAFKNFMGTVKPDNVTENEFIKAIFSLGVESMEGQLIRAVEEKMAASGIDLGANTEIVEDSEEATEDSNEAVESSETKV